MTGVTPGVGTRRGVVLVSAEMNASDATLADLRTRFAGSDVDVVAAHAIAQRASDARKAGARFVAVAGNDRAIRSAAEELAHSDTALLPIDPLALDAAVAAARGGCIETVDLGRVNERGFTNFAGVGFAPGSPSTLSRRALLRSLVAGPRLTLRLDRQPVAAWHVFVGNGCYGADVCDIDLRESVDEHLLDVRIVRADRRFARARFALALLTGRAPAVERRTCRAITIDVAGRGKVDVVLDGEPVPLATPLRFESDANALPMIRPPRARATERARLA